MNNKNDEREAQTIIETVCPDPAIRKATLSILAEGIKEANVYGRDKWAVNVKRDAARLVVGHYYICTIREAERIWIALDDRSGNYCPTIDELNSWGWVPDKQGQPDAYPNYKDKSNRIFSVNGYYSIGENHSDAWPHIRRLFFDFIYKAIYYGQRMDKRSPDFHSPGILKYMRHYLEVDLPDPLY